VTIKLWILSHCRSRCQYDNDEEMHEAQYESEVAEEDEAKDKAQIPNFHKPFKGQPNPDVFPRSPY
jgi:hypothetical protein